MLVLTIIQGPDRGRRFELPSDEPQLIGRSSEALPISDQTISRRHAELTPDEGRWYIRDLRSSNGTFVNGVRVTDRRLLRIGDQIRTGMSLFVYGEDSTPKRPSHQRDVKVVDKGEMDVSVEQTVASNDDSVIMSSPEPSQAAEFQLRVIYQLTGLIGSVTDQESLLNRVMDVIFEYFHADRGFILLQEQAEATPHVVAVRRKHDEQTQIDETAGKPNPETKGPITASRTIVRYVMRKGVGVLSSNAMSDSRFASGDSVQAYGIRSAMCVPIKYKDKLYGVIHLDSKIANFTFTEDQLTLLTAIGVQTGLALANLKLYDQRMEAERLAAVGQTVASLSHSIKNILQGMRGGADVVELGLRKSNMKVVANGWEIVARNQDRIYELAMNMLAYSKKRKPELEMTDVGALMQEVVELVRQQFDGKNVALLTDFDADMPPVPIDPGGVHQALLNLLNNALDACEPASGVVSLRCHYDQDRESAVISVADNGPGLPASVMENLFQPFHSTKGLKGTGLGLVVTKKIVDEHGGKIEVESDAESGTTITMIFGTDVGAVPSTADTHGPGTA